MNIDTELMWIQYTVT